MEETSGQTLQRILSTYELGAKLRQLRLRKKLALTELGKHTGLSASMLSQLETGKLVPTLQSLARIAMVFDVGLDYFFDDNRRRKAFTIVRKEDRIQFPERPDISSPSYFFECLAFSAKEKGLQAYIAHFPACPESEYTNHMHDGAEFIYVIEGSLAIRCHGNEHMLVAGDSLYFDSSEPHAYRGTSENDARAVVITTLPRA